jgi:hypothetical protein
LPGRGGHRPERPAGGLYSGEIPSAGAAWQIYGVLALVLVRWWRATCRVAASFIARTAPEPLVLTADLRVWSGATAWRVWLYPPGDLFIANGGRAFPGSLFAQFVWPIFGLAAVVGIGLSIALRHTQRLTAGWRCAVVAGRGVLAAWLLPGIGGLLTGGLLVGGGFCVPCSSLYMAASWRQTIRVIWRAAHHRVCGRAIDWSRDLGVIDLAYPPAGACAGAGGHCAVRRRRVGLESSR